ncbi:MAG: hypothetical protein COA79_07400 [Planctomycetota bacterium]|nr:MAG: hypothetical protein COA79_07400 [Planctomycetota bacterium]
MKSFIFCILIFALTTFSTLSGQNKLKPLKVTFDYPTAHTLSLVVPTDSGDANRNGSVAVFFRISGQGKWKESLSLYRHNKNKGTNQPFAGMLFNLKENTEYEIKLVAKDPDGVEGTAEQIVKSRTKKIPQRVKMPANAVKVSTMGELSKAIGEAKPGTFILLKKGVYKGSVSVKGKSGTAEAPIVIRGEDKSECVIKGKVGIYSSQHIHIENLTIMEGGTGIGFSKTNFITIRDNLILKINGGIYAKGGQKNLYIANNVIMGNNVFGDISNATWNDEGIVLSGEGHELANNTLAGFGDSIGMTHRSGGLKNRGIDMHHNLVVWGGDDGVEMDFTDRNAQAHHNLFTNTANGISCQMVWKGPAYVFKNVMYNVYRGPYKIKPERAGNSGLFIFNNTSIKAGRAYLNYSTEVDGLTFLNNLFVGFNSKSLVSMGQHGSGIKNLNMDYNAWSYDGSFSISRFGGGKTFQDWKTKNSQGNHDVLLAGQKIFDKLVLDFDKTDFQTWRYPYQDFSLDKSSKAIDAAKVMPGVTSDYKGKGPDIGAWERGEEVPVYGAFPSDTTPPSLPTNIKAVAVSTTQIDLTWDPAKDPESGIIYYRIIRDGKAIATVMGKKSYSDKKLEEFSEHSYFIVAVNGRILESKKTSPIKIKTLADKISPEIDSVTAMGPNTEIIVIFNEPVAKASAEAKGNYKLDKGVSIVSASLQSNKMQVLLKTSTLKEGIDYNVTVSKIFDTAKIPNYIKSSSKKTFQYKALDTLIDFSTKKFAVKGFNKFIKDRYTSFVKAGPGGYAIGKSGSNPVYNFQGVVSATPRSFTAGEKILVTWYNDDNKSVTFTPKISLTSKARANKGKWFLMSKITLGPGAMGISEFNISGSNAGSYSVVNINCNAKVKKKSLLCHKIQLDSN